MRKILLLSLLLIAIQSSAQMSIGLVIEGRIKDAVKGNAIDNYLHLGMTFKKYVSPRFNLVTGIGIRYFDASLRPLAEGTDLVTFRKDHYPDDFYYITKGDYMRFTFIPVPVGIEFKLSPFIRLCYDLENNFKLGVNETGREYLQYGSKSVMQHMVTHNFNIKIHSGNAIGLSAGVLLNPAILRSDINYSYNYMNQFRTAFNNSCLININLWGDLTFKSRKKKII